MDEHNEQGEPLNKYGEVATHDDCIHNAEGKCSGWMGFWENPFSYHTMLMCEYHSERAEQRNAEIRRDYCYPGAEEDF